MKYTYKSDQYSSHTKIIEIIKKKGPAKILDVGCASGYIGKALGDEYHLVGIDSDKQSAELAAKYYKQITIADLDDFKSKTKERYDIIIFGDVLEHLKDPISVLNTFTKQLRPAGIIIISLPNIALLPLRLRLLFGNFDYAEKGPMDRTHLHFYTLKTAQQLIKQAGFTVRKYFAIPIPLPLIFPALQPQNPLYMIHIISNWTTQVWKKGLAYQFVFVAAR